MPQLGEASIFSMDKRFFALQNGHRLMIEFIDRLLKPFILPDRIISCFRMILVNR
ncbi:MAG: hypothetical protein ACJAU1_001028 [Psychromonas sp.]